MTKQHDWFAASLFQPDLSTEDFYDIGITPDNAEIKSQDAYKNIPEVIEAFSKDGKFDDNAFDTFYNNALSSYNSYSKSEFDKKVLENYEWNPDDWMAPIGAQTRDVSAKFALGKNNPTKIQSGIEALGLNTESEFSNRELAQANEVRDEHGNKLGYTPNEKGGWFKSLNRPTLVLAQYDEDFTEIVDGRTVVHKKGELKLDEYGVPYYEELGDREIYGRDVLHYTDTLSEDGSKWNKYDFFDSDGLDKSIGGTVVKTAFKIAPYFIPYVNYAWGAINASMEIAQLLPTLGKAVNGTITNNENTALNKSLNKWESYLERFESSVSDHSRDKMVTAENFGNLVADISTQLWQQRVVGSIPQLLEKTKLLEAGSKNIKLGQKMALTYMAGTSAKETYGAFKEAGASDRTAGLAMIGNMLALNKLMQNDYFKSAIFRGGYLDEDSIKRPAWGVAKQFKNALSETNGEVTEEGTKKFLSKVTGLFKESIIPGLQKSEFVRASISEGVEETMEEAVSDISKAFTEGLNAIGIKVTKSNSDLNFGWSLQDIASRYAMAFAGGTIGGALFQANHAWETRNVPKFIKDIDNSDLSKFTYLVAQGRGDEIKAYYKKLHDKGLLGDSNLSSSKLRTTTGIKGVDEVISESAEKGGSQNDFVYNALLRQVDYIENVLKDERFAYPESVALSMAVSGIEPKDQEESHLLKAQILNVAGVNSGFFNEFNALATRTVKIRSELESIYAEAEKGETDAERKANAKKVESNTRVKELTEELKNIRKQRDEILEGKRNWYFAGQGLFVLDEDTHRGFLTVTKDKFSQLMYNKTINDLTKYEKEKLKEDWTNYQNTAGKQNAYRAYDIYLKLAELYKPDFEHADRKLRSVSNDKIHDAKTNLEKFVEKQKEAKPIMDELQTLNAKENKTDSDENRIQELLTKLAEINAELSAMQTKTESILRGSVKNELDFSSLESDHDSLNLAYEYIKSLYKDFISKRNVMRSEDELREFYRRVRKAPINSESMSKRWNAYMSEWMSDPDLVDQLNPDAANDINKDPSKELLTQGEDQNNDLQSALITILQDLEDAIGVDHNIVNAKLQEAIAFIMNHTVLNEQQAEKIIKSVVARVKQQSLIDVANEIESLRSQIVFSPIYDLLRKIKVGYSDGTLNIEDLINEEVNKLATSTKLSEYVISSKQVVAELKEAMHLLNVVKALINGSTSGLNKAINILKSKQGLDSIVELDERSAKVLANDIDFLLQRIANLLNIASWNANKKLKAHKESEIKLKPITLKCLTDPSFAEGFKKLDVDVGELWDRISSKYGVDLKLVNESNWSNFEAARIEFESELYNEVWSKNNGDISEKLIECFGDNLYKMQSTKIDPETNTITGYDLLWYVADILSMDSVAYHSRYRNVLQSSTLAPVYGQELAVRRNICMALNPDLYGSLLSRIYEKTPDKLKHRKILPNVSAVYGGAGTGKTVAISAISAEMLSFDDDVEFVYLAPSEKQAKNLANNVGKKGTILTEKDFNKLFNEPPTFTAEKDASGKETGKIIHNIKLKGDAKIWNGTKHRKVLIVDESSLFNAAQWDAISQLAAQEGGIVWALGDNKQNSAIVDVKIDDTKTTKSHSGLEDFTIVKSTELTTALRPSVVGKYDNAMAMDSKLSEINALAVEKDSASLGEYDKIANSVLTQLELKSYENPETGEIFGEKIIVGSDDEISLYLKRLSKLGTVAYISNKKVTVPDGVEKIDVDKAQGGEWDYVIIDKDWNTESKYDSLRDLYTLTQRSTKGSIIVDNGIVKALNISKNNTVTASEPMELTKSDIDDFVNWKKNALGGHVEDFPFEEAFRLKYPDEENDGGNSGSNGAQGQSAQQTVVSQPTPSGTTPTSQPTVPAQPVSTPEPSVVEPPVEEESTEPELPISSSTNVSSNTPPPIPANIPPVLAAPSYSGSSSNSTPESSETHTPKIPKANKPVLLDETAYFDMLFGKEWANMLQNNDSLLHVFALEHDTAREVAFLLSSAIKARKNPSDKIRVNLAGIVKDRTTMYDLSRFIAESRLELNIIPGEGKSIMYGTFIDDRRHRSVTIPVCVLSGYVSGKYNGTFELLNKPQKKRGEWITLTRLQEKYPWLKIFKRRQVISGDRQSILNRTDLSDKTKEYLEENMGKVMTLATDNMYLSETEDSDRIYSLDLEPEGTYYTHRKRDELVQFGIIKTAPISTILQYSFLWSEKLKLPMTNTPPVTISRDQDAWLREMIGTNALPDKDLGNRRWQIMSEHNCSRFLAKMFNVATERSHPNLTRLMGWSLIDSLHVKDRKYVKKENGKKYVSYYRSGLKVDSGNQSYWIEFDFETGIYKLFEYYRGSKSIGNLISDIPLEDGKFPFNGIQNITGKFDQVEFFARKFNESKQQISMYPQFISNQITSVFGHITDVNTYAELDKILVNDDYFYNGQIFLNVAGETGDNAMLPNGLARRFVGQTDGYITDVSEWTPSEYVIDADSIPESEQQDSERLDFEEALDDIKNAMSGILDINDILNGARFIRSNYMEELNKIIESINSKLKNSSKDWNYKVLSFNGSNFVISDVSDLVGWLQEKTGIQGDVNFDFNALNNFKFGIFSVSLSRFYITHDGNNWDIQPMQTYETIKPVLEYWNTNKDVLSQFIPDFEQYISNLYNQSSRINREVSMALYEGSKISTTVKDMQDLLIKHLQERIDKGEC